MVKMYYLCQKRYKECIMLLCLIKINISNLVILKIFYTFAFVKYKNKIK